LSIKDAPAIKSVGPGFQSPSVAVRGGIINATRSVAAFPNLTTIYLKGLSKWEEWDWEEEQGEDETADAGVAMPALKSITIWNCKLRCLPPGLASNKRFSLRELFLYKLANLIYVENFPCVVELDVSDCPELKKISSLPRLQKIRIFHCRNVEKLEGVPSLDSMEMKDDTMETVPEYLRRVNPRYLKLRCSKKLYESLLTGSSSSEYNKIRHITSQAIEYF
jgi:hypothetical protein